MSAALDAELLVGSQCGPCPFLSLVHSAVPEQALTWFGLGTAEPLPAVEGCALADGRGHGIPGRAV